MAVSKFIKQGTTSFEEEALLDVSSGSGDAGRGVALNADGKIDDTMIPDDIGSASYIRPTSENLASGDIVDVYDVGGVSTARKADATTTGKPARGFVGNSSVSPANATIYGPGQVITGLTGLTIDATYYLSTTPGGITLTAPASTNNNAQEVGYAISATELMFLPSKILKRA